MSIASVMSMVWLLPEQFPLSENISFGSRPHATAKNIASSLMQEERKIEQKESFD